MKYNNGKVIDTNTIPKENFYIAAKEWSEGNYELEQLLLQCLENNIKTQACCAGHENTEYAFVQFEFSENNLESIISIINKFYNVPGVLMDFVNQPGIISKFDIRIKKEFASKFFEEINNAIKMRQSIKIENLSPDMLLILSAMTKHKLPHDYLEIEHSIEESEHKLFVATVNPIYSDTYWDKPQAKPWVEDSVSIEGKVEEIVPIIKYIDKKANFVYSNYVDTQQRNQMLNTDMKQQNNFNTITFNAQATRENEYARTNMLTIAEILPGMSLENVAAEIVGKNIMCQFNGFIIEGNKYTSVDEILNAYDMFYIQKREEKKLQSIETKEDTGIHR